VDVNDPLIDTEDWSRGDWMQLFSGRKFYPMDPRPEDIEPDDIAHALSLLCRYGGHVDRFYSVAEHCVLMSEWIEHIEPRWALPALLHDATEAYVVDVPRPLKRYLTGYGQIEDSVWYAICLRFGIPSKLPDGVKTIDNRILLTERDALMSRTRFRWSQDGEMEPLDVAVTGWPSAYAEARYLDRLGELLARSDPSLVPVEKET
jgi:hypothetical protein